MFLASFVRVLGTNGTDKRRQSQATMLPQSGPDGDPWGPKVTKILPKLEPKADKNEATPKSIENRSDERSKNDQRGGRPNIWGPFWLHFGT